VREHRRERRLDQRLPRLSVAARRRHAFAPRVVDDGVVHRGNARREVDPRTAFGDRRRGVKRPGAQSAPGRQGFEESGRIAGRFRIRRRFRRRKVDDDYAIEAFGCLEFHDVAAQPCHGGLGRFAGFHRATDELADRGAALEGRSRSDVRFGGRELFVDGTQPLGGDRSVGPRDFERGEVDVAVANVVTAEHHITGFEQRQPGERGQIRHHPRPRRASGGHEVRPRDERRGQSPAGADDPNADACHVVF